MKDLRDTDFYVIDNMLYTKESFERNGFSVGDENIIYLNLPIFHLGNRTWLIILENDHQFEIIEETDDNSDVFRSLTCDSSTILETIFQDFFKN